MKQGYNFGLFVRGKGGNHKIAASTINLGSTKGRGSSTRMFNYCNQRSANPSECINQFINVTAATPPLCGEIDIASIAKYDNDKNAYILNDNYTITECQTLNIPAGTGLRIEGKTLTNSGIINNDGYITNTNYGTITNNGTINNNNGATIDNTNNSTINNENSGTITNKSGGTIRNSFTLTNSGILTNNFGGIIDNPYGSGTISTFNGGTTTNNGIIQNANGTISTFNGGTTTNNGIISNGGTIYTYGNGTIDNTNGTIDNTNGTISTANETSSPCTAGIYTGPTLVGGTINNNCPPP